MPSLESTSSEDLTDASIGESYAEADASLENILGGKLRVKKDNLDELKKKKSAEIGAVQEKLKTPGKIKNIVPEQKLKEKYSQHFADNLRGLSPSDQNEKDQMVERFYQSEYAINKIESGPTLEDSAVFNNVTNKIKELSSLTTDVSDIYKLNIAKMRLLVKSLIKETGPNQNSSFLLLSLIDTSSGDYYASHSINVCIFTLIIAIEVSKMMIEKIKSPEISKDFYKSRICSLKTFNENELVDLGIAALLHDIDIKRKFPNITSESNLTFRNQLDYQRHSLESFRYIDPLNLNREIKMGILQHHERLDGKGYPDGIHESIFTRFGKVLSLADHYENLAFINPFIPTIGPIGAINRLLKHEKSAYDGDLIISFIKATSLYPLGSFILLNSGEIGMVVKIDRQTMQKPTVKIFFSKNFVQVKKPFDINLNEYPNIKVVRAVHPREIKNALPVVRKQLNL